ncbi:hypothetical protein Q4S45_22090 [Massilia sp. R2A-15]|uniref:hypothetical protein n=1 Tax=Massilia sp. R2A-15 TaxID=3064278 RepID=UPI0027341760|nr:hypothetical protein [Massilia sp. R2A-15]WLI89350.1 hypothetical protein Q4S45_22090 [Massilia sp. R2A-15]
MKILIAACAFVAAGAASASGFTPYDRFVNHTTPDLAPERFQAGQLGVLQPHYERVYLYAAWRAISLGSGGMKAAPNPPGAILRATGAAYSGWDDYRQTGEIQLAWKTAAAAALKSAAPRADTPFQFTDCPREAYSFATSTLMQLAQRADATPARLQAWVGAQDAVFSLCGNALPSWQKPRYAALPIPAELAPSEGAWAQLRGYQVAAAHFYNGDYRESAALFGAIGATPNHPMRQWGAYLALRAQMREAAAQFKFDTPDMTERAEALRVQAQRILDDPSLASLHEATRGAMRAMQARITPRARFEQISASLDNPRNDPYQQDYLGDWRVLAGDQLNMFRRDRNTELVQRHDFIDWITTLNGCDFFGPGKCAEDRAHALQKWEATGARTWLVAALMTSETLPAPLELAALRVAPDAPEYPTVRYHLARSYRLSGQAAKARAIDDAMLAASIESPSMRNLFLQERFALATSNAEAAQYLLRNVVRDQDGDTGETGKAPAMRTPASDGRNWINSALAVSDLLELAQDRTLGQPLRNAVAAMAWLRADLLGQHDAALRAAALLEPVAEFADAARSYRSAATPEARRHVVVLAALRLGITSALEDYEQHLTRPFKPLAASDTVASNWCSVRAVERAGGYAADPERPPAPPETATDPAQRAREFAILDALPTSTGFIGKHVMQRALAHPDDPDLPWLLYVVVQSTKGGCLDADSHALSKQAFTLLHKRFPDNEWTGKTPYFY